MTPSEPRVDRGARLSIQRDQPEVPAAEPTARERDACERVLAHYPAFQRDQLLPLLHELQAEAGWFSEELTRYLSQRLNLPFADLYGVITFYALFKTTPSGRTVLRLCNGIPCYLRGAHALGQQLQQLLGVAPGEPTADGALSWEWFACLGQCDHAPAALYGDEVLPDVSPARLDALLREVRRE